MKLISEIAFNILKDLPGSLDTAREQAVIEAIQEFAKRSGVFKFTTEHSIQEYDVDENANDSVSLNPYGLTKYRPFRIESLYVDGSQKNLFQRDVLSAITDFDTIYQSGALYYTIDNNGLVILFPFPTDTAFSTTTGILSIVMEAVYVPDAAITEIDEFFYARWGNIIEAGAKALMMIDPGKSWSNPGLSAALMRQFDAGRNAALMKRNLEENGGELSVEKISFI